MKNPRIIKSDISRLARELGWEEMGADLWGAAGDGCINTFAVARLVDLVRAEEREVCAKVCEAQPETGARKRCAAAIRALNQPRKK